MGTSVPVWVGKMNPLVRSLAVALIIAAAVQSFTIGVIADLLPREVCRPDVRTVWTRQFDSAPLLHLRNDDGAIRVTVHPLNHIAVTATVSEYVATYEAREKAQRYLETLFKTEQDDKRLEILTEPEPRPDEVAVSVAYEILVPEGTHLDLETARGNVLVEDGCGNVVVTSSVADIDIRNPRGVVKVETTNGRIDLVSSGRQATLRTVNGGINAAFSGHTFTANTVNGNMAVSLPKTGVRSCDLTTTNGNITLAMHPACSAEVNAITREGVVKCAFDVVPLTMDQKATELRGFIGQAETQLTLSTFSGDIAIERSEG